MKPEEALAHLQGSFGSYKMRCNSEWTEKDNEAFETLWDLVAEDNERHESFEWCHECKEYDQEQHCCHRWTKQIRDTVEELKIELTIDKLREEAKKHGYVISKSQKGTCRCFVGRKYQEIAGREKCKRYEFERTTRKGYTVCRRKEE